MKMLLGKAERQSYEEERTKQGLTVIDLRVPQVALLKME